MDTKQHKPVLIVIAGPNGFGKTTITSRVLQHDWLEDSLYINPDNVAQHMFGDRNNQDAIQKGILPSPKGANVNNRWWNDRREWNLRIADILSIVPEGGEQEQDWMWFAPFGDAFSLLLVVRRFHSLRSFHQRLLKVGPLWGPEATCKS